MSLPPELEAFAAAHSTPAPPHLAALHEATRVELDAPEMLSGTVEGRLLETLVWIARPRLVLEIGT
jgi:caffeoyl-CoA O-methyltransferase